MTLLRTVRLQNIRSYAQSGTEVEFNPGFTCITGGVGQGKSTILLAIDFALTGKSLSGSYQYLLRDGEKRGLIELEFEQGNKLFKVHRVLERVRADIRQKSDECWIESSGAVIAKGKIEPINSAIASQIGLDPNIVREVAWIKQERLKLLLNLRREERQVLLDELLGLEELRRVADNLAEVERNLSEKIRQLERESGGLEDDLKDLDRRETRRMEVLRESEHTQREFEENEVRLGELDTRLSDFRGKLEESETEKREVSALQQKLSDVESSLKRNQANVSRLLEKQRDLEAKLTVEQDKFQRLQKSFRAIGFQDELTIGSLSDSLRLLRERKENLLRSVTELDHIAEETRKNMTLLQDRDKCPLCYQDIPPIYRSTILQEIGKELSSKTEHSAKTKIEFAKTSNDLVSLDGIQESFNRLELEAYRLQFKEVQHQIKDMEKDAQVLKREHSNTEMRLEEKKEILSSFQGLETAIRDLQEKRDQQQGIVARFDQELKGLKRSQRDIEGEIEVLKARVKQKSGAFKEAESRRRGLLMAGRLKGFLKDTRPKLRGDFLRELQGEVQRILDEIRRPEESSYVELDEYYTPSLIVDGDERSIDQLSGGERTLLAFTINVGLAQLVYELRTHRSLDILLLDEPTESLGTEDDSIQRLAEAIRSMKSIQQIIAVTHSEDFAQYADHILSVRKDASGSRIDIVP